MSGKTDATGGITPTGSNLFDVTQGKIIPNAPADIDPAIRKQILAAKKLLKKGKDTWNPELMKRSRDRLLGVMARESHESLYTLYYIALCDYRLATYYLSLTQTDKAEPYVKEGQKYLKKGMDMDDDFGELDALYASLLGFEIAMNPEESMSLGFQIYQYFGNKEGLYKAVLVTVYSRLSNKEQLLLSEDIPCVDAIKKIIRLYFEFLKDNPTYVNLIQWENLNKGKYIRDIDFSNVKDPAFEQMRKVLKRGKEEGVIRVDVDSEQVILLFTYH